MVVRHEKTAIPFSFECTITYWKKKGLKIKFTGTGEDSVVKSAWCIIMRTRV